jgi:SAM-dependent MidA family methyltransferase
LRQNWLTQKFPYIKPEEILEYCNESEQALENFANHIKTHKGAMLIFDYGYVETQTKCSLQAVKNHKYHNIFSDIGQADLTALVDFSQALNIINKISADLSAEIFSQGEWLETYGIKIRADQLKKNASAKQSTEIDLALKRLTHKDEMGELFKVLMLTNA